MSSALSAVERVREALASQGLIELDVREFAASTATATAAAAAIGTTVGRIVKSLVFLAEDEPILVLVSGPNRVDLTKLATLSGRSITRATAAQVRGLTGFTIGGVPPLGHDRPLETYVDRDLVQYDLVWAAAGTPNTVFAIQPDELVRLTRGRVEDLAEHQ